MAAATRTQVTATGVRIVVRAAAVDPRYGRSLPWYLNASGRPWRVRVFGRGSRPTDWTVLRGREVFFSTGTRWRPQWRAGVERAMEDVARRF